MGIGPVIGMWSFVLTGTAIARHAGPAAVAFLLVKPASIRDRVVFRSICLYETSSVRSENASDPPRCCRPGWNSSVNARRIASLNCASKSLAAYEEQ